MRTLSRRAFLELAAATGAVLALEALPGGRIVLAQPREATPWAPNPWLVLHDDGRIVAWVARAEMGQGVRTALPAMLAEELDVDPATLEIRATQPAPGYNMRTSGSGSTYGAWMPLRRAGAAARAMLVAAAARRFGVPEADCVTENGAVVHAASRRRAGYAALIAEARALPVPENVPLREPARWRAVGRPRRRVDGPAIVTGAARYGLDVRVPGMNVAVLARPPHFGATLESVDDAGALRVAGVERVERLGGAVAVVARDTWSALRGRDALRVTWRPGAHAAFDSQAHRARLAAATREPGKVAHADAGAEAALAGAARRIEGVYEYAFQAHAPMEPMNCIASYADGACDVWVGTQAANQGQEAVAKALELPPERVRVHLALLGGGFGRRLGTDYMVEAATLSRAIAGPVQVVWTREDDMRSGFFHPASAHRIVAGLGPDGRLVAWQHVLATSYLNYRGLPDPSDPDLAADYHWGSFDHPYALPALDARTVFVESPVPTGPWRAVHYPGAILAREHMLDEVARATGQDPVALRLALLAPGGPDDGRFRNRERLARVIRLAAEKSGWKRAMPTGRGRGIAANVYHGMTTMAQVAEASVQDGRIRVHRVVCAVDAGAVVNPLGFQGQIESAIVWGLTAALASEITFSNGRADQTTFADYPQTRFGDVPEIEIHVVPSTAHPSGIGEQPVAPVAAAVANAVLAATGKSVRACPMRIPA